MDEKTAVGPLENQSVARGCIEQLMTMKQKHRGMKTLLSIGGWAYTHDDNDMEIAAHSQRGRTRFVSDAVDILKNLGFDGIDIDWEYPENEDQAADFVLLLKELRDALDTYSRQHANGYHFSITIACPSAASNIDILHLQEMDKYLDSWHLMAYDLSGQWEQFTSHSANLYKDNRNPENTPLSVHAAVTGYLSAGIPSEKIVLGMPLYGKSFPGTDGLGSPHQNGGIDPEYTSLPKPGATEHFDADVVATYSYDPQTRELIAYQGKEETKVKAQYIKENQLGGGMWWQAFGDKEGDESLISTLLENMGTLENSQNLLHYPESKYENIKNIQSKQESSTREDKSEKKYTDEQMPAAGSALATIGHLLGLW